MTKICIFGAGSIGGFIATSLKKTNAQVSLIARGEHKKAIEQNGLTFIRDDNKVNFKFDGEMQPDVALEEIYKDLYHFSELVGNSNVLIMPIQHSAAISNKIMKTLIIKVILINLYSTI